MPVGFESQVFAICDICGFDEFSSVQTLTNFKKILRDNGWSIGKKVICPECNAKLKKKCPD